MTERHRIQFAATLPAFYAASATLRQLLDDRNVLGGPRSNVELAFEEVAVNVVKHGSPTGDIDLHVSFEPDQIVLTFEDDGIPFNPLLRADPTLPDSLDEAEIGGLGVLMVKQLSSRIEYERTPDQHNRLTLAIPAR